MQITTFSKGYSYVTPDGLIDDWDEFCGMFYKAELGPKNGSYFVRGLCEGDRKDENIKTVDLLIVDPIYLMKPIDSKTDDPVGTISWDLKILARKMDFPVLAASQFNREGGRRHQHGKQVDTMDAAFTDKLANNCDNMIGILGDDEFARLSFPKTRDSNITDLFLTKRFDRMKFIYDPKQTEDDELYGDEEKKEKEDKDGN